MKITAALGLVALNLVILTGPALASCHFGIDVTTGMETIICEGEGGYSSWGTMIAEA